MRYLVTHGKHSKIRYVTLLYIHFFYYRFEFCSFVYHEHTISNCPTAVSKFIRIGIADKNDNPPYFDKSLYEAEVDENEDIQHTVLTVTANDKDECK